MMARAGRSDKEMRIQREELRAALAAQFPLRTMDIVVGEKTFQLTTAEDIEQLIDRISEVEFRVDERLPYWAELWHSAVALAEFLASGSIDLTGRRVLEIGCGLALPGIVAAEAGARVTCSDFEEHARMAARLNIMQNLQEDTVAVVDMDFRQPPDETWPLILAADVIYEKRFIAPLADFLDHTLEADGHILLAEPNRVIAIPFFEELTKRGFRYERYSRMTTLHGREVEISVYDIARR
jgi:predicted nicotinamide N-methyase